MPPSSSPSRPHIAVEDLRIGWGARVLMENVTFTVERATIGRRVGRRCVRQTSSNRARRRCTRFVRVRGSFTHSGRAGAMCAAPASA